MAYNLALALRDIKKIFNKIQIMKKNLFIAAMAFCTVLFAASCAKTDTGVVVSASIVGKWNGNYTPPVGPSRIFTLNFKAGGSFAVDSSTTAIGDLATGTWVQAADSVRATYTYLDGTTGTYSLAAKYNSTFTSLIGTIGLGANSSGYALFMASR